MDLATTTSILIPLALVLASFGLVVAITYLVVKVRPITNSLEPLISNQVPTETLRMEWLIRKVERRWPDVSFGVALNRQFEFDGRLLKSRLARSNSDLRKDLIQERIDLANLIARLVQDAVERESGFKVTKAASV